MRTSVEWIVVDRSGVLVVYAICEVPISLSIQGWLAWLFQGYVWRIHASHETPGQPGW